MKNKVHMGFDESGKLVESNLLVRIQKTEYIDQFKNGHIYMSKLETFLKDENSGIGDDYEGLLGIYDSGILTVDGVEIGEAKNIIVRVCGNIPVLCFMNVTMQESENGYRYIIPKKYLDEFAHDENEDYSLIIIDKQKFKDRIKEYNEKSGMGFYFNKVSYADKFEPLQNGEFYKAAYRKRTSYKHQNEYRMIAFQDVDDCFVFDIGDLSDISYVLPIPKEHEDISIDVQFR